MNKAYASAGQGNAMSVFGSTDAYKVTGPLEITVDLPVPASWSGKRRDAALRGDIRPTSRPDTDNYVKAALDAINAIAVADDSLVVELAAEKRYAPVPCLTITITPLPAVPANMRNI